MPILKGMKTLLNLIWFVFSGLWLAIGYAIAGVIMYVLIITIPFGVASFRMAGYAPLAVRARGGDKTRRR